MSSIASSHLPILPDVLYRHLQADEDAPRYVALYQACQNVDQIDPHSTREYLPSLAALHPFVYSWPY